MTTIVATHTHGSILIGADNLVTTEQRLPSMPMEKIHFWGAWAIGMAGPVSLCQQAARYLGGDTPIPVNWHEVQDCVQGMHAHLVTHAGLRDDHNAGSVKETYMNMLWASPWGLYLVTEDRAVLPIEPGGFWAIGSGAKYALGALATTGCQMDNPGDRVIAAIDAAAKFDLNTGSGRRTVHRVNVHSSV